MRQRGPKWRIRHMRVPGAYPEPCAKQFFQAGSPGRRRERRCEFMHLFLLEFAGAGRKECEP
jgi:hypothetical protein